MGGTLAQILNNGKTSLLVHQRAIATTSTNAANVSTEGFNRRDTQFLARKYEDGIDLTISRRSTDAYLTAQILDQAAAVGSADARGTSLTAIQQLYTETDGTIGNAIDQFFNALRNLSVSPTDLDRRRAVLSAGEEMSQVIATTAGRLFDERRAVDLTVDTMTQKVNELTEKIAALNTEISRTPGADAENAGIFDRQELLVRELGELVPLHVFREDNQHLTILLNHGEPIVQGDKFATLDATPDVARDNLRAVELVNISGMRLDVTDSISSGRLGGLLTLRDETITGLLDRVDQLAYDISTEFNAVHAAGFGLDGATGRNFFADPPAGVSGSAAVMRLDASVDGNPDAIAAGIDAATAVGGNDNLALLQALEDQSLAAGGTRTFAQEIADMVGHVGRIAEANSADLRRATTSLQTVESLRESQVGISLDEEMIDLMRFQRAYQASSKVIQTVNQLYDIVMQLK